jgi:uncharacterized membrane protein
MTQQRHRLSLMLVLLLGVGAMAAAWWDAPQLVRLPLGLLAVLGLPGWSISLAVFPAGRSLDVAERLALSCGLSLATASICALALHHATGGVAPAFLILAITGCTLVATLVAWFRVGPSPTEPGAAGGQRALAPRHWSPTARRQSLVLSGAVLVVGVAMAWGLQPPRLTEFFLLGPEGLAADYPRAARPGEPITIVVGITNHERVPERYTVRVEVEGQPLALAGPLHVAPDETTEQPLTFAVPGTRRESEVQVLLLRDGAAEPYRQLRLWVAGATGF